MDAARFRFDHDIHEYFDLDTGDVRPHITGMLVQTGWIDDTWFTEESSDRGTAVHNLTADYDLDALDLASCVSPFRGYVLGWVKMLQMVRPKWSKVEEPMVHPVHKFGGRPDRAGLVFDMKSVVEVKSGGIEKSHCIQTALQAILEAEDFCLPPEAVQRFAVYLKANGKFSMFQHTNRADFDEARRIIRRCCS